MASPRFLLDEHVSHAIQDQLLRLDIAIEVLVVGQSPAPPKGTPDQDILLWIEHTGYILVTSNRRTIPAHLRAHQAAGHHVPGVLLLRRSASLRHIIEQMYLLWAASDAEEYTDQMLYLPM